MADRGPLTLLGVPIDSVGTAGGTELGPNVLRQLLGPEGFEDAGDTSRKIRGLERNRANGWLAFDDILAMTGEVRGRVADLTAAAKVPVLLGGCCTLCRARWPVPGIRSVNSVSPTLTVISTFSPG